MNHQYGRTYPYLRLKTLIACLFGILLLTASIRDLIPPLTNPNGLFTHAILALVSFFVLSFAASHYFKNAWRAFLAHQATQDTLLALGISIMWLYSCIIILFKDHLVESAQAVYFDSVVWIIAITNLGAYLEQRLLKLSRNNGTPPSQPAITQTANKISNALTPMVMIMAVATALYWYNFGPEPRMTYMFTTSVSILLIATTSALVQAISMPFLVGMAKAARHAILVKDAQALYLLNKVNVLLLAKTGTVTVGKPRVINVFPAEGYAVKKILTLAAKVEGPAKHPYAMAIKNATKAEELTVSNLQKFQAFAGLGVSGELDGEIIAVGNASFMEAQLIPTHAMQKDDKLCSEHGETFVYVAQNKRLIGGLSIADPLRVDAKATIARLAQRLRVIMITGDPGQSAQAMAKRCGISEVVAGAMPAEQTSKINLLHADGNIVAMVADPTTQSNALRAADVAMAITDDAQPTNSNDYVDILIGAGSIKSVATIVDLAHKIKECARQNLLIAAVYNAAAIPMAAGALYPILGVLINPLTAGIAMTVVLLIITANANRLLLSMHKEILIDR